MPRVVPKARTALLIFLLGVGLTFASLGYKEPTNCNVGLCEPGEQTAGFPFPFVRDDASQVGESPTSSWSVVDIQDYLSPDIKALSFNILFYSAIIGSLTLLSTSLKTRL
jgi:hypothetical protein